MRFGAIFSISTRTMAWRSHGTDNADLVRQLRRESSPVLGISTALSLIEICIAENGVIKIESVAKTMLETDRRHYCPKNAYMDAPQSIGYEVTISAPHMHAFALELLADKLVPGAKVLDVGSGSGYLTACFSRMIGDGQVVGVEHQPSLVKLGLENIRRDDRSLIESGKIRIIQGDGRMGCKDFAPYDAIHVGAAAPNTPHELIKQLANGGRLIVPVGPENQAQSLQQFEKDMNGVVSEKSLMSVVYVPLTDLKKD